MTGFPRRPTGRLELLLEEMSELLEGGDLWSARSTAAIERIHGGLLPMLHASGEIRVDVSADGRVSIGGSPSNRAPRGGLGQTLAAVGVRRWVILPGLEVSHLTGFLQTLGLVGATPSGPESDLVTYWSEEGVDTIQIVSTSFEVDHLEQGAPRRDGEMLPEVLQICALSAPPDERAALARDWPRVTGLMLGGGFEPARPTQALSAEGAEELRGLYASLERETETSARRQFMASLMAGMSAQRPTLRPIEYAILAERVAGEQMLEGAWDDILRSVRNLEFCIAPETRVSEHTRRAAQACLTRMRSPSVIARLVAASESETPPYRLVRWFLGEEPLPLWRDTARLLDLEDLEGLVALFSVCYAFEHPFWHDAIDALDVARNEPVRNIIAQLETRWVDEGKRSPAERSRAQAVGETSAMSWDEFDFDTLDDVNDNELDASLIAFLDASDSTMGSKASGKQGGSGRGVASAMVNQLDALERSIVRSSAGGDSDNGSAGR